MKRYCIFFFFVFALCALLIGCSPTAEPEPSAEVADIVTDKVADKQAVTETPSSETASPMFIVPEYEIELVAKTLRGECYDEQHDDKREVVWVICNRVSDGRFGDSIEAVITAPRQFQGYRPGNVPTANDYEIAREVLTEWYEGGCQPLGKYLFFSAGGNHRNIFRENY